MSNTIGRLVQFTSFGESHGPAIGGVLDGLPSNLRIDFQSIEKALCRRQAQSLGDTSRHEPDHVEYLSGIYEGLTLGTPIAFIIRNSEARSKDYEALKDCFRPGHADYTYFHKYGHYDWRGGGRSSARETVSRVVAGELCRQWLSSFGIHIEASAVQIGGAQAPEEIEYVRNQALNAGDTLGAEAMIRISACPRGLGEPLFDKLQAVLSFALMSIPAVKAIGFGKGFEAAKMRGSEHNDQLIPNGPSVKNIASGLLGGIATGEDIEIQVAFKPLSSIHMTQDSINRKDQACQIHIQGRHDICALPRALVILEAQCALALADQYRIFQS